MRHKKLTKAAAIGLSVIMAAGGSFTALATPDVKGGGTGSVAGGRTALADFGDGNGAEHREHEQQ